MNEKGDEKKKLNCEGESDEVLKNACGERKRDTSLNLDRNESE